MDPVFIYLDPTYSITVPSKSGNTRVTENSQQIHRRHIARKVLYIVSSHT